MTPTERSPSRLDTFVDAAFAFAVTLLVISVGQVPRSVAELITALKGVPAFALAFTLIAMFWLAHHRWSRRYALHDAGAVMLSLLLVFLVLVYVYPLRVLTESLFGWLSGGWIPSRFTFTSAEDVRMMFVIYGAMFTATAANIGLLYGHAFRQRARLGLTVDASRHALGDALTFGLLSLVGLCSVAVAAVVEFRHGGLVSALPGLTYFLAWGAGPLAMWLSRRWARRAPCPVDAATPAAS